MEEKLPKKGDTTPLKEDKELFIDSSNYRKDKVVAERIVAKSESIEELKLSDFDLALKKIMSYKMKKE